MISTTKSRTNFIPVPNTDKQTWLRFLTSPFPWFPLDLLLFNYSWQVLAPPQYPVLGLSVSYLSTSSCLVTTLILLLHPSQVWPGTFSVNYYEIGFSGDFSKVVLSLRKDLVRKIEGIITLGSQEEPTPGGSEGEPSGRRRNTGRVTRVGSR